MKELGRIGWRDIDPDSSSDVAELKRQRKACGWDAGLVDYKLTQIKAGNMIYWFFILIDPDESLPLHAKDEISHEGSLPHHAKNQMNYSNALGTGIVKVDKNQNEVIIGSGGLDLAGVQDGSDMASHDRREFCLMGIFLYEVYV